MVQVEHRSSLASVGASTLQAMQPASSQGRSTAMVVVEVAVAAAGSGSWGMGNAGSEVCCARVLWGVECGREM